MEDFTFKMFGLTCDRGLCRLHRQRRVLRAREGPDRPPLLQNLDRYPKSSTCVSVSPIQIQKLSPLPAFRSFVVAVFKWSSSGSGSAVLLYTDWRLGAWPKRIRISCLRVTEKWLKRDGGSLGILIGTYTASWISYVPYLFGLFTYHRESRDARCFLVRLGFT